MKKEIVKTIEVFRALEIEESMIVCEKYISDILSECYSRVLRTSCLYGNPSLRCFTESIKTANEYAQKPGYSGKIAMVKVCIWNDGTCSLLQDNKAFVHRLWKIEDWLHISRIANNDAAKNLNYKTKDIELPNIISFGGQATARAYAFESKIWIVHTKAPVAYAQVLSKEEVDIKLRRRSVYPSLHSISYTLDAKACEKLLVFFDKLDEAKAWVKCTKKELISIKGKFCVDR